MLTEECRLNEYLMERGVEVINSELGIEQALVMRAHGPITMTVLY